MAKLPDEVVKKAREADIVNLIENYGVKLDRAGHEFKALCPFHSEKSPSFTVTPDVENSGLGRYHCFGCGAAGGTIQFVMDYESVDFRTAVEKITGVVETDTAPRERRTIEREQQDLWLPLSVVPERAPKPKDIFNKQISGRWTKLKPAGRWEYFDPAGGLIGYIYRFDLPGGGKEVIPQTYCVNQTTGEMEWKWQSFGKPRPIYGLNRLAANPDAQVLVVEGEKACDAARALFLAAGVPESKLVVASWPGGGKAIKHCDWTPLYRRRVALWRDADQKPYPDIHALAGQMMPYLEQPGTIAMRDIYMAIRPHCDTIKVVPDPVGVPDGWDLADEAPAGFNLLAHMKTARPAAEVYVDPVPEQETELERDTVASREVPPWDDEASFPAESAAAPPAPVKEAPPHADDGDKFEDPALTQNGYFRVLGYDHERFYFLQYEKCQIMVYTKSDFSEPGLIELAPLDWWEGYFPGGKNQNGIDKRAAMNWLVRTAHKRGVYSMTRLRGRGGWTDKGRIVFHHGDFLTVDGKRLPIAKMDSFYVYEMAEALPDIPERAMTCEEGRDLLDLASIFRWAKPASAALLAGWVALAPIGGVIKWRPHIWLTGGAGSGKTTVLNAFVHHLMNGMDLFAQGNSTEAGMRQELKGDARPVLFDESESQEERERLRIQQVLAMIRQASSESQAKTYKGTAGGDAMAFHIRSMFCLASIQVGIKYQADIERMTVLALQPKHTDPEPEETWKRMSEALYVMQRDESLPGRLIRRSLDLLPITLKNIATFSEAAAIRFGSQRDGDQYGTLLAGAWSLISRELATREAALMMIDMYDWSEHRENNETDEGERALASLMGALVRISGSAEVTVNELIRTAKSYHVDGITMTNASAEAVLQRHGMRIDGNRLVLSNSSGELRRLMSGTPFESDLRGVLLRLRGADRYNNRSVKFNGVNSKAISIPLDGLLDDDPVLPVPADDDRVPF
jgi:hypothetical protein